MTNIEKWNHYKKIIDDKAEIFMDSLNYPKIQFYFVINFRGEIQKQNITGRFYNSNFKYGPIKILTKDVKEIKEFSESEIIFDEKNVYFNWESIFNGYKTKSAIKSIDFFNKPNIFLNLGDAEVYAEKTKVNYEYEQAFRKFHAKDKNYNYFENGYKFLGWQNGWYHVNYDEDGKITTGNISKGEKPAKSFGYEADLYPEYRNCIDNKHQLIEVSYNNRGSENTVSCPLCKVYWKYDSSD